MAIMMTDRSYGVSEPHRERYAFPVDALRTKLSGKCPSSKPGNTEESTDMDSSHTRSGKSANGTASEVKEGVSAGCVDEARLR